MQPLGVKAAQIRTIYQRLLESWNTQDADAYARLFADDGYVIGFDGSEMIGRDDIRQQLTKIFTHHQVSSYVSIIREVKQWWPNIYMLTATAGMVLPGESRINPKVNAVQTLVARFHDEELKIVLFQNTPAAYHGRPEKSEHLTNSLNEAAASRKTAV
jgi:uncharacterized protein (TIGR02246 family)